ncbi:hypothetical protein SEA_ELESAR_1 [Arthrobacter phage Elesar]|uniref:Uncharacterized protein n=1 Tax=Arthrobacter phage Elesar TaxID=2510522 RepID=A0A411CQQ6_9CAUD|nr:hypothetical protein QEO79_gp01 [Arthrobacter phage Elesar]QAY16053.1 hypothetical protein SEA_ELESAR_1 [Arthrobacter phage Elesar]
MNWRGKRTHEGASVEKKLTRDEAIEIVTNVLADRPSGPDGEDVLEALGITRCVVGADEATERLGMISEWAKAMIDESYYPQYGRDVKTLIEAPIDELRRHGA